MTLIVGVRCRDGVILAADRRRLSKYEKGPSTTKVFKLSCGVVLAGAGDDGVLYEARVFIDRRIKEIQAQASITTLLDVVEVTASVINELVNCYRGNVEEPFGYVLSGLENLGNGSARLYSIFGAGFSDIPSACLGSGSSYARPLVELLLADGNLQVDEVVKTLPTIFSLVSNVQTTVGDGVDISIIRDDRGLDRIRYEKEVSLDRLKAAILDALIQRFSYQRQISQGRFIWERKCCRWKYQILYMIDFTGLHRTQACCGEIGMNLLIEPSKGLLRLL